MLAKRILIAYIPAACLIAVSCFAEDKTPPRFYRLDFVVKELEGGKVLNARTYSAMASTGELPPPLGNRACSIRTGSKVPIPTVAGGPGQFTYLDLGVSIDCYEIKEELPALALRVEADISSAVQESSPGSPTPPVIRQNKWTSGVLVFIKKPTVLFSSDDVSGKHQMQLELTATPIL